MARDERSPMPASQAEWDAHWAFYRLTVTQRDLAWREVREWRRIAEALEQTLRKANPASPVLVRCEAKRERDSL